MIKLKRGCVSLEPPYADTAEIKAQEDGKRKRVECFFIKVLLCRL
jgi:hypothetical protein